MSRDHRACRERRTDARCARPAARSPAPGWPARSCRAACRSARSPATPARRSEPGSSSHQRPQRRRDHRRVDAARDPTRRGRSISITPCACGWTSASLVSVGERAATNSTAAKAAAAGAGKPRSPRYRLRQVNSWLVLTPCRCATACTVAPGMKVSATSCRFSSSDQRRRACPRKISIRPIHSPQRLVSQPLQDQS
jgi:hypothetical protein